VAQLLRDQHYSLQSNRKTEEGADHPDRDAQFRHINAQVKRALTTGMPVISVDTKNGTRFMVTGITPFTPQRSSRKGNYGQKGSSLAGRRWWEDGRHEAGWDKQERWVSRRRSGAPMQGGPGERATLIFRRRSHTRMARPAFASWRQPPAFTDPPTRERRDVSRDCLSVTTSPRVLAGR
jgi:Rhodopirellula transposase DDE domain